MLNRSAIKKNSIRFTWVRKNNPVILARIFRQEFNFTA